MTTIGGLVQNEVEENTLGVVAHDRRKARSPLRIPVFASSRIIDENAGSLGTAFLGFGAMIVCVIIAVFSLGKFTVQWERYASPAMEVFAWLLYAVLLVSVLVVIRRNDDRLSDRMFVGYTLGLLTVVALDLGAIWPLHDVSGTATAAIAAGVGVLAMVGVRPLRQVLATAMIFGALLLIADLVDGNVQADHLAGTLAMLSQAVLPAVIGCFILRSFRRMVTLELDRVLVQSTVSAPRYAVGMLASEELARLDLAAEQLLEGVSSGRTPLPLDARVAQTAASLATELRLHLIEGRRETWLYHAISESELLGPAVTLSDPNSLAGLLDPRQRDGLLSAIWLLVSESGVKVVGTDRTARVTLGPSDREAGAGPMRKLLVPIVIQTSGVARNRVDPGTWDAIRKVGKHADSVVDGSLRLEVECVVENPADA